GGGGDVAWPARALGPPGRAPDAARSEPLPGDEHGRNLALPDHNVVTRPPVDPFRRHVEALGRAAEEPDVLGAATEAPGQGGPGSVRRREEALASRHAVALVEQELGRGGQAGAEDRRLPPRCEMRHVLDADESRLRDQARHGHLTRRREAARHGGARPRARAPALPRRLQRPAPADGWTSRPGLRRPAPPRGSGWS